MPAQTANRAGDKGEEDPVRQVEERYGAALRRIMQILQNQGKLDPATVNALTADDLVSGLLLLHGAHPHSLAARVAGALEKIRPYLGSHGLDVELEGISPDGVVRLQLLANHEGASAAPFRSAVHEAIGEAAPEVTAIDIVEGEKPGGHSGLIPVDSLVIRENTPPAGTPVPSWHDMPGGTWEPVPEIAGLESGEVAGFLVRGYPVVACRLAQDIFACRDYCPRCTGAMMGATLQRNSAGPAGIAVLCCPTCRGHFDLHRGGICLDDRNLHLDLLPLLVRHGVLSVAVPSESVPLPAVPPPGPDEITPAEMTPVQAIPLITAADQPVQSLSPVPEAPILQPAVGQDL
ncbi:NifU family protein [Arthrobacter sp. NPDC057388]|uniref:NifU family protein n=1 Tax=Arthrobacter sp. NPDC057388 TaxID=3346116 RepID=UPI003633DB59